jgi:hypothetical protein
MRNWNKERDFWKDKYYNLLEEYNKVLKDK